MLSGRKLPSLSSEFPIARLEAMAVILFCERPDIAILLQAEFDRLMVITRARVRLAVMPVAQHTKLLDFSLLRNLQGIVDLNAQVSNRAFKIAMSEQQLYSA